MLANGRTDYLFRTIDPPIVPKYKYSPSRSTICIAGTGIGLVLSISLALILFSLNLDLKFTRRLPWVGFSERIRNQ